jgi:hypothetical protein
MTKARRELRKVVIAAKITSTDNAWVIKKCEKQQISASEYINKLIKKDKEDKDPV